MQIYKVKDKTNPIKKNYSGISTNCYLYYSIEAYLSFNPVPPG